MNSQYENIADLRNGLLNAALLGVAIAAIPSLGLSLARASFMGWKPVMAVHVVLVVILWSSWLARRSMPYLARALCLLFVIWLATFAGLAQFGPAANSKFFAPVGALLCVFLFDFPVAAWLISVCILGYALLGYAATRHWLPFDIDYPVYSHSPIPWLSSVWDFFSFMVIVAYLSWQLLSKLKSSEEQARIHAEHLQKITANVPGVIYQFRMRADGRYSLPYASSKLYDLIGLQAEPLRTDAEPLFDILHGDDLPIVKQLMFQSAREREVFRIQFRIYHPERGLGWLDCHATPESAGDGDTLWHGFVTDITQQKASETALQESKALFHRLFELLPMPLCVVDRDGRILELNSRFIQTFGYTHADIVSLDDWWPLAFPEPAYRRRAMADWNRAVLNAQQNRNDIQALEYRVTDKRGKTRTMIISGITLDDGFLATFFDISQRKEAERSLRESESRFRQLVENSPVAYLALDMNGYILDANDKFCKMAGYPLEQLIAHSFNDICIDGCQSELIEHFIDFQQAAPLLSGQEIQLKRADGEALIALLEWRIQTDMEGRFLRCHCVLHDISERKRTENALLEAKLAAESANSAKSMFLASMSHELRTPLNIIIGFAELLNIEVQESGQEDQKESVAHIVKAGRQLSALVDDVLDLARIEAGKLVLSIEAVGLEALLNDVLISARLFAAQRNIALQVENCGPLAVLADRSRLRQVLQNLLSNAVKYNLESGRVTVYCQKLSGNIRICVDDTGQGIAAEWRSRLFQPFQRLGAETTHIDGAGIGLVLSKHLVEAMHGRIGFDGLEGGGSRFWLELPSASFEPPPVKPDANVDFSVKGRVVYVEDNPGHLSLITHLFRRLPMVELRTSVSAVEGLELIRETAPDLVLMDISLPGMSGLEALKALKADPSTAHIPVVAVSAAAMADDVKQGLAAGFFTYLTKPLNITELLELIGKVLAK